MSDFDADVIYGVLAKPKRIEKLKSEAILTTKWYGDDDLYQIADWLGKKYKAKLKRKKISFTCSPWISGSPERVLGFSICSTGMSKEGVFECNYLKYLDVMNEILKEIDPRCKPKLYLSGKAG